MGQISSSLLKKAFATWQHAFLSTSITFYNGHGLGMHRNKNFEVPILFKGGITSEVEERPSLSQPNIAGTGVNGLIAIVTVKKPT